MKKLLTLLLALTIITALAACSEGNANLPDTDTSADTTETSDTTQSDTPQTTVPDITVQDIASTYTLVLENGMMVTIGGPSEDFIASAGEPIDYLEAPSCIHEGFDKVYTFDWYSVTTSPTADGGQRIEEFSLLSDAVALESGITIGSTTAQVEAEFGTEFEDQFGIRVYKLDGATLSIVFTDDAVSGFTVSAVTIQ